MSGAGAGVSYVLPLRWAEAGPIEELCAYLGSIAGVVDEILVVDGSPKPVYAEHAAALRGVARHLPPYPDLDFQMGKANGVLTGVRECSGELVVLADDDVRYDPPTLRRTVELLGEADLVRPQNYFDELPWHARWDTARSLLNRVFTGDLDFPVGDFPGTFAVRRESLLATGYDGDALFENLEMMRTIRAAGGTIVTPLDLYVARRPPNAAHFLSQRIRQAYDDFAIPPRIGAFLAVAPLSARALRRGRAHRLLLGGACLAVVVAEIGRRRAGGATRFPLSGSLLAPVWVAERSVCSWLALVERLRGGVLYGGRRLRRSATPPRRLRRRHAGVLEGDGGAAVGPEADRLVGPVAKRADL